MTVVAFVNTSIATIVGIMVIVMVIVGTAFAIAHCSNDKRGFCQDGKHPTKTSSVYYQ